MASINEKIYEVQRAVGNRRGIDLKIGKGKVTFDMDNNQIIWELDVSFKYSELGLPFEEGVLTVLTEEGNPYKVTLSMNYSVQLSFEGESTGTHDLFKGDTPYQLLVENKGNNGCGNTDNKICVEIREV
jgi:hypothetical protein